MKKQWVPLYRWELENTALVSHQEPTKQKGYHINAAWLKFATDVVSTVSLTETYVRDLDNKLV